MFGQAVLTSLPKEGGFPFFETTTKNLEDNLNLLYEDREFLFTLCKQSRDWAENKWNPKKQVNDFLQAYKT